MRCGECVGNAGPDAARGPCDQCGRSARVGLTHDRDPTDLQIAGGRRRMNVWHSTRALPRHSWLLAPPICCGVTIWGR